MPRLTQMWAGRTEWEGQSCMAKVGACGKDSQVYCYYEFSPTCSCTEHTLNNLR